ncbi:aldose epimerase family protein [Croceibacterium ferulae]|uniref:aldose epimerase family protein n=1 Tax=Croceibacterium ferulae TaxID=1854641 RepID=UPI0018817FCE|nr:aldose epimerase family protein [Croceibacterium ferulae]
MKIIALLAAALPMGAAAQSSEDPTIVLRNAGGMSVEVIPQGAIVKAIMVPDRTGEMANVVLGYPEATDYRTKVKKNGFGATIGRYAGRIAGARFTIDGRQIDLVANDGANALHGGGAEGFDTADWQVSRPSAGDAASSEAGADEVTFTLVSPDGFQNFPGELSVSVTYRLAADNALHIEYSARTTRPTAFNITNHSYFNLAGEGSGIVAGQWLKLEADRYIVTDEGGIPTGELAPVAGTPMDFRCPYNLGERIANPAPPLTARGYNHAWLFDKADGQLAAVALLIDPGSGRTLTIETTEPSIQVYTGGYIDGTDAGPSGHVYQPGDGIALEVQHVSDSPNQPQFPTTILRPGQTYRQTTIWRFGTDGARSVSCS